MEENVLYGGREQIFSWRDNGGEHAKNPHAYIKGEEVLGRRGVAISMMRILPATLYTGELFDISCTPIVPNKPENLAAVWAYCTSEEYGVAVRRIDQKVSVTNATLAKVPFDLEYWTRVAAGHAPLTACLSRVRQTRLSGCSVDRLTGQLHPLQVATLRLLAYRWPRQTGSSFLDCPELCQDELDPRHFGWHRLPAIDRGRGLCSHAHTRCPPISLRTKVQLERTVGRPSLRYARRLAQR